MLSSTSESKAVRKNLFKNSNLDDSRIYLPPFLSRITLKLHNINLNHKLVKKVVTSLDM